MLLLTLLLRCGLLPAFLRIGGIQMSSLDELVYYCKIKNPVGALLLTGEWGCGKTYLVENKLKKELDNSCVIVRISLFGIKSTEELHNTVKKSWINAKGGLLSKANTLGKYKKLLEKIADLIPHEQAKGIVGGIVSYNFLDLIDIDNKIGEKNVVLVFDDLERSRIDLQEKLGVINEYCENRHFNTIIVADETKLNDAGYKEFKEKVIQRTIHFSPNYKEVVQNIIDNVNNEPYKQLLLQNEQYMTAILSGKNTDGDSLDNYAKETPKSIEHFYEREGINIDERKKLLQSSRPHNIRSLKSAIQDFERVFRILEKKQIEDINK